MSTVSLYTVYDRRTDEIMITSGTVKECSKKLNITVSSFYTIVTRFNSGHSTRWGVIKVGEKSGMPNKTSGIVRKTFGQKIKYHRYRMGITNAVLAKKIGVSTSLISKLERDLSEPSLFVATCLADVFGVSLDYLAGRKTDV